MVSVVVMVLCVLVQVEDQLVMHALQIVSPIVALFMEIVKLAVPIMPGVMHAAVMTLLDAQKPVSI